MMAYLKANPGERFTARQIAEWLFSKFPKECEAKKENSTYISTDSELLAQIVAEIGSQRPALQRRFPEVRTTESRPRKYYWSDATDEAEVVAAESRDSSILETQSDGVSADKPSKMREADLYPLLSEYLASEHRVYSKRIDERKASNRAGSGGNRWLYPDVVGMENLTDGWHREILDVVGQYGDKKTLLWSFEVKILLNRSNVREAYFQAVSNSSWANLGYLVATEIEGVETMRELRMLFALHGIGVIHLNSQNPAESQIVIPAREKPGVDWETCNRLTNENPDFLQFLKLVRQFHQTGDPRVKDWDASLPK